MGTHRYVVGAPLNVNGSFLRYSRIRLGFRTKSSRCSNEPHKLSILRVKTASLLDGTTVALWRRLISSPTCTVLTNVDTPSKPRFGTKAEYTLPRPYCEALANKTHSIN